MLRLPHDILHSVPLRFLGSFLHSDRGSVHHSGTSRRQRITSALSPLVISVLLFLPGISHAQIVDNFDSYTNGALNGQGSWSGGTAFTVQGTTVQGGTKAVSHASVENTGVSKGFTIAATGTQSLYIRAAAVNVSQLWRVYLIESGNNVVLVTVTNTGQLQYFNGASYINWGGTISANTWYKIDIQWDKTQQKARYRLDGGTWTAYDTLYTNMTTGVNTFTVNGGASDASAFYLDTLADGAVVPSNPIIPILGLVRSFWIF